MADPHRIYIVEDNLLVRQGYIALIEMEPDLVVCGAAERAEEALAEITSDHCDIILVDVMLPGMDGLQLTSRLRAHHPHLPVLVISGQDKSAYDERALEVGARAYIDKQEAAVTLIPTIRRILGSEGRCA